MREAILHVVEYTSPGGGPSGYVYNLRQGLEQAGILGNLVDTFALSNSDQRAYTQGSTDKPLDKVLKFMGSGSALRLLLARYIALHCNKPLSAEVVNTIAGYRAVVFHSARFAFRYLINHPASEQKVFVMLHQPVNFAVELVDDWQLRYGQTQFASKAISKLADLELQTYLKATGVVTTTTPSLNAYFDFDPVMRQTFQDQVEKHELPSGVPPLIPTKSQQLMRQELGIAEDTFVIGFFGRFHPHKGFDLFIEAAKLAHQQGKHWLFLTAGAGSIEPPKNLPNLMNLGWRQDIADIANLVDVVVIPNRVANFDLLALEVMSLSKPIIASAVGGSLYLASTSSGVQLFQELTPEELFANIGTLDQEKAAYYGQINQTVYQQMYNPEAFINRHINFAKQALGSN